MVHLDDFDVQKDCWYRGEHYSVRDNGAVMRHSIEGKRARVYDNFWTWGKVTKSGYLDIASATIHRIVATAFHGDPPTKQHVVDHIDTNRQNNRPENLRWVTRLENILLNTTTVSRILRVCGSVEEFLSDPSKFRDKFVEPNYEWMCTVSKEEAQQSKARLLAWAASDMPLKGGTLGSWLFNRGKPIAKEEEAPEYINSLTNNAVQKFQNWRTPTEFPLCPREEVNNTIVQYYDNLKVGEVFSRNHFAIMLIDQFAISADTSTLWVVCKSGEEGANKPFSLSEVTYSNDVFVHESLGTFFERVGVEKQFVLKQGVEWPGGDTLDDFY
jgi:hypothetical protein